MSQMELQGAKELQKIMEALGGKISQRAGTRGVLLGARLMKRELKAASPVYSGILSRREWVIKKLRSQRRAPSAAYVVRLKNRFYYDLLEFEGVEPGNRQRAGRGNRQNAPKRAGKYHPFALKAMEAAGAQAVATIMAATKTALAVEAGKAYARSKRNK